MCKFIHADVSYRQRLNHRSRTCDHISQMIHQIIVAKINFTVYMWCMETGRIDCTVIYCSPSILRSMGTEMSGMELFGCMWAHLGKYMPTFADTDDRKLLKSRLPLWNTVNKKLEKEGPMNPVRVLRNKTKKVY